MSSPMLTRMESKKANNINEAPPQAQRAAASSVSSAVIARTTARMIRMAPMASMTFVMDFDVS